VCAKKKKKKKPTKKKKKRPHGPLKGSWQQSGKKRKSYREQKEKDVKKRVKSAGQ